MIASDNLDFEQAAKIRDRIKVIEALNEKQNFIDLKKEETDVFGIARSADFIAVSLIKFRNSALYDKKDFVFTNFDEENNFYPQFIIQYYSGEEDIPREILIDEEIEDKELIEQYLKDKSGHPVHLISPKRGEF